jgi:putative photosynthetic complex assembly protein 2
MNTFWSSPVIAAGTALFLWWFFTGAILLRVRQADRGPAHAHRWSVLAGLPVLGLGGYLYASSLNSLSLLAVYQAFGAALLIWGWIELAFLSGVITGPNRRPCPPGVPEWERFFRAIGTIMWHETALIATLALMAVLSLQAANDFAFWTFGVLFFARISAKLNLFFGVPRIHTEFLPRPLMHLASHFRIAPMTLVFPVSVTVLSFAVACFLERAWDAGGTASGTGHALLCSLTVLALLEHWFMVLPLPDQKLWRWMLPDLPETAPNVLRKDLGTPAHKPLMTLRK